MVRLKCERCGHAWDYTGSSDHYCTCPNCKTSVKVQESREDPEERGGTGGVVDRVDALEKRLVKVDELTESLRELGAEDVPELHGGVDQLDERVEEIEEAVREIADVLKDWMEKEYPPEERDWEGVEYESELLNADPDQDAEMTVPEAAANAGVDDPAEGGS